MSELPQSRLAPYDKKGPEVSPLLESDIACSTQAERDQYFESANLVSPTIAPPPGSFPMTVAAPNHGYGQPNQGHNSPPINKAAHEKDGFDNEFDNEFDNIDRGQEGPSFFGTHQQAPKPQAYPPSSHQPPEPARIARQNPAIRSSAHSNSRPDTASSYRTALVTRAQANFAAGTTPGYSGPGSAPPRTNPNLSSGSGGGTKVGKGDGENESEGGCCKGCVIL